MNIIFSIFFFFFLSMASTFAQGNPSVDVKASTTTYLRQQWCKGVEGKCWFKDRQEGREKKAEAIASAFRAVWGSEPLELQRLALALCLKETGCGFSEERSWRKRGSKISQTGERIYKSSKFMSSREACGLTQVDTRKMVGRYRCAWLNASYLNAFKAQKAWLKGFWNDGGRPAKPVELAKLDWLKPVSRGPAEKQVQTYLIYRYNGGGPSAWRYGREVMAIYNMIVVK